MERVVGCIENGVPVYHADLDHGLPQLPDQFFDYVILEKTLQAVASPMGLLDEMLRLGKTGIISFPNFGYKEVVKSFVQSQRMPRTKALPYNWYDTPNIHLFTARDFLDLVEEKNIKIEIGVSWIRGKVVPFKEEESGEAEEILFMISRIIETLRAADTLFYTSTRIDLFPNLLIYGFERICFCSKRKNIDK